VPGLDLLIVASVAAAAAGLDRLVAAIAVRRVAGHVAELTGPGSPALVRFAGAAFLPQLLRGVYREIDVTLATCTAGSIELRALTAQLCLVRAPIRLLLRGRGLVAGQISGQATIPFSAIASRLPAGLEVHRHGEQVRVRGTLLRLPVTGRLAVTSDGQRISVVPSVLGVPSLVGFVLTVPGLPRELTIDAVRVTDAGLEISMSGDEVILTPR
jgi:hypothetical protein